MDDLREQILEIIRREPALRSEPTTSKADAILALLEPEFAKAFKAGFEMSELCEYPDGWEEAWRLSKYRNQIRKALGV